MGVIDTAGDISKILADYEANKAKGNLAQGDAQQRQANAAANIYRTQADVALKGPEQSARAAALGDQMANIQPFQWTGATQQIGNIPVPQSTGGLSPANFGPATRKAGSDLASLSADRVSSPNFNLPKAPILPPLPTMSTADSVLSDASLIGSLLKAASGGGSGGDISKLLQKLLGSRSGGPSIQGDKPYPGGALPSGNPDDFTGFAKGDNAADFIDNAPEGDVTSKVSGAQGGPGGDDAGGYFDEAGNYVPDTWTGAGSDGNPEDWTDPSLWGG